MQKPWPEMPSTHRKGQSLRDILDYICWITTEMGQLGFHAGSDRAWWCTQVHKAYAALFVPMVSRHGDPYPPDVPPAQNPGIWPDIPSSSIPGMTLRHQLTVTRMLCDRLRARVWPHIRPNELAQWDGRLSKARTALEHGADLPIPQEARSEVSAAAAKEHKAQRDALKSKARKRALELRRQMRERAKKPIPKKTVPKPEEPVLLIAAKKKAAKKTASKKAPAKKTASKKAPAKKAAKKAAPKKTAAKKTASKKAPAKKTASKKAPAKKTAKKATPKKTASKKTASKKAPAKKTASKKAPAKKTAKKKAVKKKTAKKKPAGK